MLLQVEISGNRGGPPAADETADQRLLPLHRRHPCSSGTGKHSFLLFISIHLVNALKMCGMTILQPYSVLFRH